MGSLQFSKVGSAATLPLQEKNNSAVLSVQWQVIPRRDVPSTSLSRWP
jgi:hypothetical protein